MEENAIDLFRNWTPKMVVELLDLVRYSGKGGRNKDPEVRDRISKAVIKSFQKGDSRKRISETMKRVWANYTLEEKENRLKDSFHKVAGFLGKTHGEYARSRISESSRNNIERKEKISGAVTTRYLDWKEREKTSKAMRIFWSSLSPKEQKRRLENSFHSERSRLGRSKTLKEKWKDPEFVGFMRRSQKIKPNGEELFLNYILNKNYPGEWTYNGDGREGTNIGGRIPDFININGKKEVIELFGPYWHPEGDVQDRVEHYAGFGYRCIIIWTYENNEEDIVMKVKG